MAATLASMSTSLVTGASAGIGKEFCVQLAARGHDLVVVARNRERLAALAEQLGQAHGIQVEVLPADLTDEVQARQVGERLADAERPVDLLVNNAGYGLPKPFLDTPLDQELNHLDLHVRATLILCHAAAPAMRDRGHGAIINVSSVASLLASGTYSAAKSWISVFSESLATQLHGTGVTVTALLPGFTHTEFHERGDIPAEQNVPGFMWLDADRLVRDCLADVDKGRAISVPGRQYKVIAQVLRHAPRSIVRNPSVGSRHRRQG